MSNIDEHDEQVRIAVKALGDMRNSSKSMSPTNEEQESVSPTTTAPPQFVSRVSHIPLVSTALRAYEQGKNSSRVLNYGAGLVESSVKTISRPVIDRLPVDTLDEFACRQLDRLESYRRPGDETIDKSIPKTTPEEDGEESPQLMSTSSPSPSLQRRITKSKEVSDWLGANKPLSPPSSSKSTSPPPPLSNFFLDGLPPLSSTRPRAQSISQLCEIDPQLTPRGSAPGSSSAQEDDRVEEAQTRNDQQVVVQQRSRWQAVLLEAGGFSAALSEESMRRLKYCLHWLQYATDHIDSQILILRDFVTALQPLPHNSPDGHPTSPTRASTAPISPAHMRTLTEVRRDVVHTIRQVVDVVSKYAGSALPEPARVRVRGFILKLPQKWATAAGAGAVDVPPAVSASSTVSTTGAAGGAPTRRTKGLRSTARSERGTGAGDHSTRSSRPTSPMSSRASSPRRHRRETSVGLSAIASGPNGAPIPTAGAAVQAAQKILVLSTESLDMMRGVTGVVKDSLERAEAWVGRLRAVGLQRGADARPSPDESRRASEGDVLRGDRERSMTFTDGESTAREDDRGFDREEDDHPFRGLPPFHFGIGGSVANGSSSSPSFHSASRRRSSIHTDSSAPSTPGGPGGYYDYAGPGASSSRGSWTTYGSSMGSVPGTPVIGEDLDLGVSMSLRGVGELNLNGKLGQRGVKEEAMMEDVLREEDRMEVDER